MPDQDQLMKRQQVLADFGEFAIRSDDLDAVLTEACRLVGEALGTGRAKVLEIQEGRQELLVRAGVGWAPNVVGSVRLQMSDRSSETYAIRAAEPVISQDIATETRFDIPEFMKKAGVVALVNVPIFVPGQRPYGVLQVDAMQPREFGDDEIQFLRTYAMILGPVIDRLHLLEERTNVQRRLESSEARHRLLIDSWAQATWEADADGIVVTDSPSWRAYTGQTVEEWLGYGWLGAVHPKDRFYAERQWREAIIARRPVNAEFRIRARDGGWRWTNVRAAPVPDTEGRIDKWAGMNIDIDIRKQTQASLRESEARQRALIEGVPQLVWRASHPGHWTWASPQWTQFTGQREEDSRGWGWLDPIHPDDRGTARAAWSHAVEHGHFEADYRICAQEEGTYRWFQTRATPIRDGSNRIVEWLGTSTDVDDLRRSQERQQILLAELQHRVRNILGVIRSIISRSDDGERSTEDYVAHLQGRIAALARTQVLLTRTAVTNVDLEQLIWDELLAQVASDDQVGVVGETIAISPKSAEVLTLAIHELATNATKYGAFSRASGRLDVRWRVEAREGRNWLVIVWQESGVPIDTMMPHRQGFGSELIRQRIPYELKGYGSVELKPDGVESHIEFPLFEGESILQTDAGGR